MDFNNYLGSRFYLGPDIVIGYEKRSNKNRFLFTIGGFFDAQFKLTRKTAPYQENGKIYVEADEVLLNTGIELRWRYCNLTEVK